jgi:hypothetical protein
MSGQSRLSRETERRPSSRRTPQWNFGLVAFVLLATLAIAAALMFPNVQSAPPAFLIGP